MEARWTIDRGAALARDETTKIWLTRPSSPRIEGGNCHADLIGVILLNEMYGNWMTCGLGALEYRIAQG
jgi:hypothetical protein